MEIDTMRQWMKNHEADQNDYRKEREKDEKDYRREMYICINGLKSSTSKWAIGILSSVVTILIVQIFILIRESIK